MIWARNGRHTWTCWTVVAFTAKSGTFPCAQFAVVFHRHNSGGCAAKSCSQLYCHSSPNVSQRRRAYSHQRTSSIWPGIRLRKFALVHSASVQLSISAAHALAEGTTATRRPSIDWFSAFHSSGEGQLASPG